MQIQIMFHMELKQMKKVKEYYKKDHTHTSLKGARHNAKCVAKGLKKMKSPLAKYLK